MQAISPKSAIAMIPDGASLMIGGFMGVGTSELLVDELVRQGKRELTVIANDTAAPGKGIGKLVSAKLPRKAVVSHIGLNPQPYAWRSRSLSSSSCGMIGVRTPRCWAAFKASRG